jgi:serine protease Do
VRRGWLGVAGANAPLARRIARHHEIENASGVRVRSIEAGSPAKSAGVEPGDLIVSYDGEIVTGIDRLQQVLNAERIGRSCEIVVLRHARKIALGVTAVEKPQG